MPSRVRTSPSDDDATPTPAGDPPPEPVAPEAPALPPAAESADPRVHRLLFERQAATDASEAGEAELERIAAELAELGYR